MKKREINVYSEIGNLKTVLLHRPGKELENLTPSFLENLLFDDIPYLKVAQEEHDNFAKLLEKNEVEVLYLERLMAKVVSDNNIRNEFIEEFLTGSGVENHNIRYILKEYFMPMLPKEMVEAVMAGVRLKDLGLRETSGENPFILNPMPNLYFTRDAFACIGHGVTLNSMKKKIRRRETLFGEYIFKYHPEFKESDINIYYDRNDDLNIEGGDELILSDKVLAIGSSERTDEKAIIKLSKNIFESNETFNKILIFNIPKKRACMHLDTVFTMVDHDKFTIYSQIEKSLKVTELIYDKANKSIIANDKEGTLESILSDALGYDVTLIRCGGGDEVISEREQWNDGSNTLTISPGKVITYDRNYVTNELLDKNNIEVCSIKSSELSRGRGGPRCMSMPFVRENI